MIIGSEIIKFDHLTSTNRLAQDMMAEGRIKEGLVICAGFQSAGKGQVGNTWESESGKNLLISIILHPKDVLAEEQFVLNEAISMGICDFLSQYTKGVSVKWPNDIYVNNDKIAGILIENSVIENSIESSVAGIGLNLNQERFSPSLSNPISLKQLTGVEYDINSTLNELLKRLDIRYRQLLFGDRDQLKSDYENRLFRKGEWHPYSVDNNISEGFITGVASDGRLRVQDRTGKEGRFLFKEIEFVL